MVQSIEVITQDHSLTILLHPKREHLSLKHNQSIVVEMEKMLPRFWRVPIFIADSKGSIPGGFPGFSNYHSHRSLAKFRYLNHRFCKLNPIQKEGGFAWLRYTQE